MEEKDVKYGPIVYDEPDNLLIYEGTDTAFLDCKVRSNPVPDFDWLKDGKVTTSSDDTRYVTFILLYGYSWYFLNGVIFCLKFFNLFSERYV